MFFTLKDFRNAIAHNGVVLDVRFQSGSIDYVILLVYLMRRMGFTKTECKHLVAGYGAILERCRSELPINIYSKLIKTSTRAS